MHPSDRSGIVVNMNGKNPEGRLVVALADLRSGIMKGTLGFIIEKDNKHYSDGSERQTPLYLVFFANGKKILLESLGSSFDFADD